MWIERAATLRAAEAIVSWMRDWEKGKEGMDPAGTEFGGPSNELCV